MRYRENHDDKRIIIRGKVPLAYRRYRKEYPFIFTDAQLFSLVFQAWWRFYPSDNWASQLYLLTESIPPSTALFTHPRAPYDYYQMINTIFDAVNAEQEYLHRFFYLLLERHLSQELVLLGVDVHEEDFTLTFSGTAPYVNSY